ncbi:MAG TPA: hypothetical protein VFD39_07645 [Trueperaceae bacterium]|nr:hypothetical protein [Trueperaceae bacterium]
MSGRRRGAHDGSTVRRSFVAGRRGYSARQGPALAVWQREQKEKE